MHTCLWICPWRLCFWRKWKESERDARCMSQRNLSVVSLVVCCATREEMRTSWHHLPRFHVPSSLFKLETGARVLLSASQTHHLRDVLRSSAASIRVFNSNDGEFVASLLPTATRQSKRCLCVIVVSDFERKKF